MNTRQKIKESNRIEGIDRPPTQAEIDEHERFVCLEKLSISELEQFVKIYQPTAILRTQPHLNVRVGSHVPPRGGPHIVEQLQSLLTAVNEESIGPWEAHTRYETLHPFTDGNGRSGRAIWYWAMSGSSRADLGFLHAFYYQTLNKCAVNSPDIAHALHLARSALLTLDAFQFPAYSDREGDCIALALTALTEIIKALDAPPP